MANEYLISASIYIEAESEEDAAEKFWELVSKLEAEIELDAVNNISDY